MVIKARGGQAISVKADVAVEGDVEVIFKSALDVFGRIDVVVHSAGITPMGKIVDGDLATFDKVIATNLRGTFIVLSHAARHLADGGRWDVAWAGDQGVLSSFLQPLDKAVPMVAAADVGRVAAKLMQDGVENASSSWRARRGEPNGIAAELWACIVRFAQRPFRARTGARSSRSGNA